MEKFIHVPANDIDAFKAAVTDKTGVVMLEVIQGESGVHPMDKAYLEQVRKLCDEQDILLIFDEVQTGMGRTGTLFAYEQFGIKPDVVSTAKGIGGGLPLGACMLGEKVENTLGPSSHGSNSCTTSYPL